MNIESVNNNVIFKFIDETLHNKFINSSKAGIVISSLDIAKQSNIPRWGRVTKVGPLVEHINEGDYILIEQGKWTQGFYVDNVRYWKTDDKMIMATSDEPGTVY